MSHLKRTAVGIAAAATMTLSAHGWSETLPSGLTWMSNMDQPVFANQDAPKGGTVSYRIDSFPLTLRTEGPDSNGGFAGWTRGLFGSLMERHPDTREFIPYIASEWALAGDNKTMYFKLNKDARWSDGEKVTADDFVFTKEFMTSEHIQAPWYNDYYSTQIEAVVAIDEYTLKIVSGPEKPVDELYDQINLRPLPEHAIRPVLNEDWVEAQNWTVFPTVAAYQIDDIDMGKQITLERQENWWAKDMKFMKGRYNVDKIRIKVIRDTDVTLQALNKGELDAHQMIFPAQWHSFNEDYSAYANGYIQKTWAFNDSPQGLAGVWLNQEDPLLSNLDVRLGIAHAMNVPKMLEAALYGDYQHLQNLGSGYGKYENSEVKAFPFNPDMAREYFAKAGYTKQGPNGFLMNDAGEELKVELLYLTPAHTPRTSVLQEEAKKAGLNLELNLLAGAQGFKAMLEKNHQAGFVGMGAGMLPSYWQYFHSDNAKEQTNNFTMTKDEELDKLILTYRDEFDSETRIAAAHEIQKRVMANAAYIPTYSVPFTRAAHWSWLKVPEKAAGLEDSLFCSSGLSNCYGRFWVDADEKKKVEKAMKDGTTFETVTRIDTTWKK
jgi:microcin C transport system substrate-binding protein